MLSNILDVKNQFEPNKTSDLPLFLPHLILLLVIKCGSGPPQMNKRLVREFDHQELL